MTCQILVCHGTHEEEQDIGFASSSFEFQLRSVNVQILTCHVSARRVSLIALTNV
jgi:hypothetical protein